MDLWVLWLLAFLRAMGVCFSAPVLNTSFVPLQVKIALAAVLSFIGYTFMGYTFRALDVLPDAVAGSVGSQSVSALMLAGAEEVGLGLLMGFGAGLALVAVHIAGHFIDIELGLGMVQVLEPGSSRSVPLAGNLFYLLALAILLETNQHHMVIAGFMESLRRFPPGKNLGLGRLTGASIALALPAALDLFSGAFAAGIKMSLPVVGCLFIATALLGVLSRAVPQMNVFMVGIPVKALLGFFLLGLAMPSYASFMSGLVEEVPRALWTVMRAWG
ncbi:MAG TPA: flagellar biosynthetic protein FliR [Clostridia bacterium]|nr:flagellar biosynthetic protein FliR [Clostridia bacterium]